MDQQLLRSLGIDGDLDVDSSTTKGGPGKSTLTSKLTPAPQVVFRVSDPETARALGESFGAGSRPRIQRDADSAAGARDGNGVMAGAEAAVDRAASSSGAPLPTHIQRQFEGSLGADLSSVRVHTGSESQEAAHAVGAKAYTVGNDIHFAAGRYQPEDPFGMHLLAHEVAHTVQQSGGAQRRQNKLEVSTPYDSAEHEADRAADAMVRGEAATVDVLGSSPARRADSKLLRDVETSQLEEAGKAGADRGNRAVVKMGTAAVTIDKKDIAATIADIDKYQDTVKEAEREEPEAITRYHGSDTNVATRAALQIFDEKIDTTKVDTTAFAVQYRTAIADYGRIAGMAAELTAALGIEGGTIDDISNGMAATKGAALDENQAGLERFRRARSTLNGAAKKMDGEITAFRGASQGLQGALYAVKAKAAAVKGAGAAEKLKTLRAEIDQVAKGVGTCVKIASTAAGLAGGGGAVNALAVPKEGGGGVDIDPSRSGLAKGGTVYTDPEDQNRAALVAAMGKDAAAIAGVELAPDKIAESLVKAIGEYANKEKLASLAQEVTNAAAEEKEFKAASEASAFAGFQTNMEAAAKKLSGLISTYQEAKAEMADAGKALVATLNKKGGTTAKSQAKGVLFLTESDRFLAQVKTAIAAGEHQQANAKDAAESRKSLRGTDEQYEDKYRETKKYYRCEKLVSKGAVWDSTVYQFTRMDVKFSGGTSNFSGGDHDLNQGGAGSVEGSGGAADIVAQNISRLKDLQTQVVKLQGSAQSMLGLKGPGSDA